MSASESNGGYAVEISTNKLNRTVDNFIPVTTSTPLLRLRCVNDSIRVHGDTYDDARFCHSTQSQIAGKEEIIDALDHISEETIQNEKLDVLEVESMDMSDSNNPSPVMSDATRKLFGQSTMASPNQQSSMNDETLPSNATRLIFKAGENNRRQSGTTNEELKMDTEKLSVIPPYVGTADMDISSGDGKVFEVPIDVPFKQLSVTSNVADEPTDILFESNSVENDAKAISHKEDLKNIAMIDDVQISNNISSSMECVAQQVNVASDLTVKSVHSTDKVTHSADDITLELSSQLGRQHISNELLLLVRKTTLESPAALPKKKIRLFSPEALPLRTNALLFGSPKYDAMKDKVDPINIPENTTNIDKSTDKVLSKIKHQLRHSLNHSGVFTLSELSAAGTDNVGMLYDIPMPESLFHSDELNSQVSTAESFSNELHTTVEQSCIESSSLSSRRSEIVTAALGNESSFLTSHVDTVGFNINFRTIPCFRIKPNEQPQIMELKQLATTNLRKRIAEVIDRCKGLISAQLPNCSNRKIAECIRTLNPRKLSKKEASWFDVCYLMAQREWFVLRAKLAKLTSEKLDELLLETKAESDQKRRLAESMRDYEKNRDEVMERYAQLKSLDEAVDGELQNEMELDELRHARRVGRLEVAQKELELMKKQGTRLEVLLKEYGKTKSAMGAQMAKKAAQRAEFLQNYDEDVAEYREFLADKE
uniref:Kinetochore scaffold 1 n=1 Tax=Loa loa TaxID=7209 RepID=A0A1I7VLD8_LOALO